MTTLPHKQGHTGGHTANSGQSEDPVWPEKPPAPKLDWDVWEIAPQSLLCTYLKPTELGVISRDRTRVAEQINPSTIDHRSTRERPGTVSPGQSSAIKQEGARAVIKMTFGRSRPSAQRGLTVSPIRRVAARWSPNKW